MKNSVSANLSKSRLLAVIGVLAVWIMIITVRFGQLMIQPDTEKYTENARFYYGRIPAMRGRILDEDGTRLAWSTRHIRIRWRIPRQFGRIRNQWEELKKVTGDSGISLREALGRREELITVRNEVSAENFPRIAAFAKECGNVTLSSYFRRHYYEDEALKERLGRVITVKGMEIGVSGVEKARDSLLRGRPGVFRVRVGPDGRKIPGTWKKLTELSPGYDVYVPLNVQENNGR